MAKGIMDHWDIVELQSLILEFINNNPKDIFWEIIKLIIPGIIGACLAFFGFYLADKSNRKRDEVKELKSKLNEIFELISYLIYFFFYQNKKALLKDNSRLLNPDELVDTQKFERALFIVEVYFPEFYEICERLRNSSLTLQGKLLEYWGTNNPRSMDNKEFYDSVCGHYLREMTEHSSKFGDMIKDKSRHLVRR